MTSGIAQLHKLSRDEASAFVERYEHLGNVGLGVWHWALRINGTLSSVVSFGVPCFALSRGFMGDIANSCGARVLQLCRGATAFGAPPNSPSKIISLALGQVAEDFGPSIIVAYADIRFSEVGTIYQACNAIYTGLTNPKGQANYLIDRKLVSGWVIRKRYGTRCRARLKRLHSGVVVLPLFPKLRYILLAGSPRFRRHARRLLEPYRKPYPKRWNLGIAPMDIREMVGVQVVAPVS